MVERLTNTFQYITIVLVGLFFCSLIVFFIDEHRFDSRIYRNVVFAGTDVSLMTQEEFFETAQAFQENIQDKKVYIEYDQELIEVSPKDIGLQINPQELWEQVYEYGHSQNLAQQFVTWIYSFSNHYDVTAQLFADKEKINTQKEQWESFVPTVDPYNGNISITEGEVVIDNPQPGSRLDTNQLASQVLDALISQPNGTIIEAPLILVEPERSLQDLVDARYTIELLIGSPITLHNDDYDEQRLVLSPQDLSEITRIHFSEKDISKINITIDPDALNKKLQPLYPRKASYIINEDEQVTVRASKNGFDINISETADNILDVIKANDRNVSFVVNAYVIPSFSTEDAEALNITHLVSRFTTYHSCCKDRVENIHLVADILDGKYLEPGEVMNLNDVLGERTQEQGFKNAGTIIKGKLEESVGGGISQFVTTFHNAVYWGGYRIVAHKPHSIYFSRYPIGIEATINWPYVDYIFQNDTDSGLYIDTSYDDESITVSFYGSNDGRQVIGDHRGGSTNIEVTGTGPDSRTVISQVSEKYNFHEPLVEYVADTSVERGSEIVEQVGDLRWSVVVTRTVKQEGEVIRYDQWPVHYRQDNTIIRKHPCDFYDTTFDYSQC